MPSRLAVPVEAPDHDRGLPVPCRAGLGASAARRSSARAGFIEGGPTVRSWHTLEDFGAAAIPAAFQGYNCRACAAAAPASRDPQLTRLTGGLHRVVIRKLLTT